MLHLLYARFWHKVLFDLGHVSTVEPFQRLFNQGYIQAYAYTDQRGVYVEASEVVERDGGWFLGDDPVNREYGKMGKSLRNVVTPDDIYTEYGADTLRLYEMFMGPLDASRPWNTTDIVGVHRFLQRLWRNVVDEETGAGRVADTAADRKYIVCNADEGDSGTYADRMIMEGDPFLLIEGMAIAGFAVGASKGFVYIRSEYPDAVRAMERAVAIAEREGLLGQKAQFEIEVRVGAGAYVCGEETSLLESLEGKRGQVRAKPPLPAHKGLFGKPTVVNNVITLATLPAILRGGPEAYQAIGMGRSRGTMPLQLAGNIRHGGLFEAGFGLTLGEIVDDIGGGTRSGFDTHHHV